MDQKSKLFLFFFFSLSVHVVQGQTYDFAAYHKLESQTMWTLSSWASANIVLGTTAYALSQKSQDRYFHEMNVFWNTVNLGLGIAALAGQKKKRKEYLTFEEAIQRQKKVENIFLINTGLDVIYMGVGITMKVWGQDAQKDRWQGYGDALLLQGGFLFVFDGISYFLHRYQRLSQKKQSLNLGLGQSGIGFIYHLH